MEMKSATCQIADFLLALNDRGIKVWNDNGCLRYRAPRGTLTPDEIQKLRLIKNEILMFLQKSPAEGVEPPALTPRPHSNQAPLSFTQWWRWRGLELDKNTSMRSIATGVRLFGDLDVELLCRCFAELIRRHDSLRTKVALVDGIPRQCIEPVAVYNLAITDLTHLPGDDRRVEAMRLAERFVRHPISVAVDSLFAATLVKLADCDHLLVIATDHIISDVVSMGIIWEEVFTLYVQSLRGSPFALSRDPIQFADYAVWQENSQDWWAAQHHGYWTDRLAGSRRVQLFPNGVLPQGAPTKWSSIPIRLGRALSFGLQEVGRQERTTLVMVVLAIFTAVISRWYDTNDLIVPFIAMGRPHVALSKIVGFFGAPLFLRMELFEEDTFCNLLGRVTNEYRSACEHDDAGRIVSQMPTPEFWLNPVFNWIPQAPNMDSAGEIDASPVTQQRVNITVGDDMDLYSDGELVLLLSDTPNGVEGDIHYRADLFDIETMERFRGDLYCLAERALRYPQTALTAAVSGRRRQRW